MLKALPGLMAFAFLLLLQPVRSQPANVATVKNEAKPFTIRTAGKEITIKSNKPIQHIMLWTSGGNRLVEQKNINQSNFSFRIPVNGTYFFLMIALTNGKVFTEKIAIGQ